MSSRRQGSVVVGVADSVFRGWALRWAAEQARLEGRALTLVNASGPLLSARREFGPGALASDPSGAHESREQLLARARAAVDRVAAELEVDERFEVADPATLLTRLSSTAHLLVLGSRGRGPIRSNLLGSVGLAVVRHAACPVVVHRPGDHPGTVHRGVVVAADATEESRDVLTFAFRTASLRGLPLKVVHTVQDVWSAEVGVPAVADLSENAAGHAPVLAESLAGYREQFPDVHLTVETVPCRIPETEITRLSRDADLVVVGTHQRNVLGRALAGSVSESVLKHSRGPVAVVPTAESRHT